MSATGEGASAVQDDDPLGPLRHEPTASFWGGLYGVRAPPPPPPGPSAAAQDTASNLDLWGDMPEAYLMYGDPAAPWGMAGARTGVRDAHSPTPSRERGDDQSGVGGSPKGGAGSERRTHNGLPVYGRGQGEATGAAAAEQVVAGEAGGDGVEERLPGPSHPLAAARSRSGRARPASERSAAAAASVSDHVDAQGYSADPDLAFLPRSDPRVAPTDPEAAAEVARALRTCCGADESGAEGSSIGGGGGGGLGPSVLEQEIARMEACSCVRKALRSGRRIVLDVQCSTEPGRSLPTAAAARAFLRHVFADARPFCDDVQPAFDRSVTTRQGPAAGDRGASRGGEPRSSECVLHLELVPRRVFLVV